MVDIPRQRAISAQGLTGCVIDDCGRTLVARGMCRRHYAAWWRCTPKNQRSVAQSLKQLTPAQRFARKVTRGGSGDCWPFTGSCDKFGHGQFYVSPQRGTVPAHVFAVELATGIPCPESKEGCHRCDNPPCCNPDHVYYGTRQENVDDMWSRGRGLYGEKANGSKLTMTQVVAIRVRFASGEYSTALAAEYGVRDSTISLIVNGLRWAHVGGPIRTHNKPGRRPSNKHSDNSMVGETTWTRKQ